MIRSDRKVASSRISLRFQPWSKRREKAEKHGIVRGTFRAVRISHKRETTVICSLLYRKSWGNARYPWKNLFHSHRKQREILHGGADAPEGVGEGDHPEPCCKGIDVLHGRDMPMPARCVHPGTCMKAPLRWSCHSSVLFYRDASKLEAHISLHGEAR